VLAACVVASSLVFIDGSALTVALPILRVDFDTDFVAIQWILNGYVLPLAALTLVGGALADAYGKAQVLAGGCILFGLMSAACALAPSIDWLIAARVLQGVAAAIVAPASLALIGATYPRDERTGAIGVWAATSALTTAAGPILGGWLTETIGWPFVFWINPPLALIAVGMLFAFVPEDRRDQRSFDLIGAVILAAALGCLAWAFATIGDSGPQAAASTPKTATIAIFAGFGLGGLIAYASWERISKHPMTPPRLAGNYVFFGLNLATLMIYAGLSIMFFLLPFDLVDRRGLLPANAGLAFLPFTLGVGLLSWIFGGLADKIGARPMLVLGPAAASVAYAWIALGKELSVTFGVIGPMTLLGLSFAVFVAPLTASVMSSVEDTDEGLASGINNAASRIAQLIGVALAAGAASFASGYEIALAVAAFASLCGSLIIAAIPARPSRGASG